MKFIDEPTLEEGPFDIDITSLIDVVFLMLIFFMVTTTFIGTSAIEVELPSAHTTSTPVRERDLVVSITATGEIFVDREKVNLAKLDEKLIGLGDEANQTTLIVRADKSTDHGSVVAVLDLARLRGLRQIAIATAEDVTEAAPNP